MLLKDEFDELVSLIRSVEIDGNGGAKESKRKSELEASALKQEIITASYRAKYPELANHMQQMKNSF